MSHFVISVDDIRREYYCILQFLLIFVPFSLVNSCSNKNVHKVKKNVSVAKVSVIIWLCMAILLIAQNN